MISARALDDGVVGVRATETERDEARLARFAAVPDTTFVWTVLEGGFHLGRITGPVRTDDSEQARRDELVHVRPCDWIRVEDALVPEQVRYAFSRGGRNFQRIGLPGAGEASARVWDLLA